MTSHGLNLRRFISSTSLYAIGDLITKSARFILIPYYVHVLSKDELGALGVLQAIAIAAWTLFAFSCGFVVPRYYYEWKEGHGDRFVASLWWARIGLAIVPCLLTIAVCYAVAPRAMPQIPVHLVALSIISGFLRSGFNIIESWFVIRDRPIQYRTFTLLQFLSTTFLIIYLVSVQRMGIRGAVIGEVISYSVWTVVSGVLLGPWRRVQSGVPWTSIFTYCASLLPHTIFMWAIAYSDRVVLQQFVSLQELGTYELAYTLASTLSVAALAMRSAWLPSFFRSAGKEIGRDEYAKTASYFFAVTFLVAAGLVIFAPEAVWIITSGRYEEAVPVMRVVLGGVVGFALFMAMNQPLLYDGRNLRLSAASFTTMVLNIGLNLLWVPKYGIMGAAYSTLITYLALASIAFAWTRHYFGTKRQREMLFGGGIAAAAVAWLGSSLPEMPLPLTLGTKALLVAILFSILASVLWRHRASKSTTNGMTMNEVLERGPRDGFVEGPTRGPSTSHSTDFDGSSRVAPVMAERPGT